MRRRASIAGHSPAAELKKLQTVDRVCGFGEDSRPGTPSRAATPSSLLQKSGSQILGSGASSIPVAQVAGNGHARRAVLTRRASMSAIEMGNGILGGGRRQSIAGSLPLSMYSGLSHLTPLADDNKERMERASEMLKEATRKEDSSMLLEAIGEAKAAHMDASCIREATQLLQQISAKESLKQITKGSDLQALKRAIAIAKGNGAEVHFAQALLESELKLEELEAVESLRIAMSLPETGSLQLAVRKARCVRNPAENLKALMTEAQVMLEKLEAHRALMQLLRSKDPDKSKLQDAIEKATSVGLRCPELDRAMALLESSPETQSSTSRLPMVAQTKTQEIQGQLLRAISLCESGGLRDAIKRAVACELQDLPELEDAKALVAMIEARRLLDVAVKGKTPNKAKLQEAIAAATSCGLPPEQWGIAQQMLEVIEARDNLSAAITSKDPAKLTDAIKLAQSCGVERAKILKAEGVLQASQAKEAKQQDGKNAKAPLRRASTISHVRVLV